MVTFRVKARTALERTRLADHGDVWRLSATPHRTIPGRKFLESVKTGHQRWWINEQLAPIHD